jgi:hypothetical protein
MTLYVLVKGETVLSEATQLGELGYNANDHSPTGWMMVQMRIQDLGWLHKLLDDQDGGKQISHVLMDIYPVHIADSVRLQVQLLKFEVYFIPCGMTDKSQPLDHSIFSCMKSTARAEYLKLVRDSPECRITKEHAVQILQTACDRLSVATLESARTIYQDQEHWTRITRTRDSGQRGKVASTTKHCEFTRYEGIAIAAVLAFATEEKSFVTMRKIIRMPTTLRKIPNSLGSAP